MNKKSSKNIFHFWKELRYLLKLYDVNRWIVLLIFLISTIASATSIAANIIFAYIIDNFLSEKALMKPFDNTNFIWVLIYLIGCYVFGECSLMITHWFTVVTSQKVAHKIRMKAYKAIMSMPVSFFEKQQRGALMSTLTNDVDNVANGLLVLIGQSMVTFNYTFLCLGFIAYFSPYLFLVTIATLPLFVIIIGIFVKLSMPYYKTKQNQLAKMNSYTEEVINGQHVLNSFNKNKETIENFRKHNKNLFKPTLKANIISGISYPIGYSLSNVMILIVISVGIILSINGTTGGNGMVSVGSLIAVYTYIRLFTNKLMESLNVFQSTQQGVSSSSRLKELIELKPEYENENLIKITSTHGDVEFQNVSFSYTNDLKNLQLKNVSFKAKKGDTIAIVGATGAGKTTIVNLLSKFYLPTQGKILLDGIDIDSINSNNLRTHISTVLQDVFLFNDSIMENIRYGNLDATDEEVIEACRLSHAHDFILKLENGYQTQILEENNILSQGEKQLISISRAILANKNILILDEATSNVDIQTEKEIQKSIINLTKEKTSFIIAHRLSTIINATKILVVKQGEIIEQGNHEELIQLNGEYKQMYESGYENNE
ncbi:ABC transporter ATP-binding protein [Mycoplasma phocoenae]|uniref:ABC transporter ATP-binding protein n=1 Tax=Mycoplasma phocoenae TaxID=754517 RepID=A0A858U408_9MOLU|nr:ABC transporter ATP-binding protein [Mycoplasma phocoenae]QJG66751.1 ABC transporter ATP-binding protein [Mycoplasma phocoenae]